jgi:hypothetical protein
MSLLPRHLRVFRPLVMLALAGTTALGFALAAALPYSGHTGFALFAFGTTRRG